VSVRLWHKADIQATTKILSGKGPVYVIANHEIATLFTMLSTQTQNPTMIAGLCGDKDTELPMIISRCTLDKKEEGDG